LTPLLFLNVEDLNGISIDFVIDICSGGARALLSFSLTLAELRELLVLVIGYGNLSIVFFSLNVNILGVDLLSIEVNIYVNDDGFPGGGANRRRAATRRRGRGRQHRRRGRRTRRVIEGRRVNAAMMTVQADVGNELTTSAAGLGALSSKTNLGPAGLTIDRPLGVLTLTETAAQLARANATSKSTSVTALRAASTTSATLGAANLAFEGLGAVITLLKAATECTVAGTTNESVALAAVTVAETLSVRRSEARLADGGLSVAWNAATC